VSTNISERHEWLEADGLGGFASGTAAAIRTRRYHALLLSAATPPTGRQVLVAGLDAEVMDAERSFPLSSQRYARGVVHPDGASRIESFDADPWPRWTYRLKEGVVIEHSLFVPKGLPVTVLRWRALGTDGVLRLTVRPFFAARDYHSMQHENGAFRFDASLAGPLIHWKPYEGVQSVLALSNGTYTPRPDWYRNFEYAEERARGLDAIEDLACPGAFEWDLTNGEAVLVLSADNTETQALLSNASPEHLADTLSQAERDRRRAFPGRLERSADAYLVRRSGGSPTGAGTPSSRCAGCASRQDVTPTRCRSCLPGHKRSRRGCCQTALQMPARPLSSTRSTRPCGSSSRSTN
jgi:predicted glycogen debranching enzyme